MSFTHNKENLIIIYYYYCTTQTRIEEVQDETMKSVDSLKIIIKVEWFKKKEAAPLNRRRRRRRTLELELG